MRWNHGASPAPQAELEADYKTARDLGGVRLGEDWLFFPKFSGTSYLPYTDIVRIWVRQEEVIGKLGCRWGNLEQFHLMVIDGQGQLHRAYITDHVKAGEALAQIPRRNPSVQIGKPKD